MLTTEARHLNRAHRAACFDPEAPLNELCAECREVLRRLAVALRLLATADATSGKKRSEVVGDLGSSVSTQETLPSLGTRTR